METKSQLYHPVTYLIFLWLSLWQTHVLCESTVNREGPCWKRRRREKAIQERRLLNVKRQKVVKIKMI